MAKQRPRRAGKIYSDCGTLKQCVSCLIFKPREDYHKGRFENPGLACRKCRLATDSEKRGFERAGCSISQFYLSSILDNEALHDRDSRPSYSSAIERRIKQYAAAVPIDHQGDGEDWTSLDTKDGVSILGNNHGP